MVARGIRPARLGGDEYAYRSGTVEVQRNQKGNQRMMSQEGQAAYIRAGWEHRRGEFKFDGCRYAFIEGFGRHADRLVVEMHDGRLVVCPDKWDPCGQEYRLSRRSEWMTRDEIIESYGPAMDVTGLAYAARPALPPAR